MPHDVFPSTETPTEDHDAAVLIDEPGVTVPVDGPATLSMVLRHEQVRLFVQFSRVLRRLIRTIAWDSLSAPERRRLRRAIERLESDLVLARILSGAGDRDGEKDTGRYQDNGRYQNMGIHQDTGSGRDWREEDDEV